jgi:hypothetical protein
MTEYVLDHSGRSMVALTGHDWIASVEPSSSQITITTSPEGQGILNL